MAITIEHGPSFAPVMNASYLAGLGKFAETESDLSQRQAMQNQQLSANMLGQSMQHAAKDDSLYGKYGLADYNWNRRQSLADRKEDAQDKRLNTRINASLLALLMRLAGQDQGKIPLPDDLGQPPVQDEGIDPFK